MAKTKTTKAPAKEKPAKAAANTDTAPKYGVSDLAKIMGVKDASARVQLRNHNIEKRGKSYGWDTKEALQAVADSIKPKKKAA